MYYYLFYASYTDNVVKMYLTVSQHMSDAIESTVCI